MRGCSRCCSATACCVHACVPPLHRGSPPLHRHPDLLRPCARPIDAQLTEAPLSKSLLVSYWYDLKHPGPALSAARRVEFVLRAGVQQKFHQPSLESSLCLTSRCYPRASYASACCNACRMADCRWRCRPRSLRDTALGCSV